MNLTWSGFSRVFLHLKIRAVFASQFREMLITVTGDQRKVENSFHFEEPMKRLCIFAFIHFFSFGKNPNIFDSV